MGNHLFLFTLGPVQSFIAQARKAQDLYAGSQILSRLVGVGKRAFEESFPDGKVIFPTVVKTKGDLTKKTLPNRFVGKISDHEYDGRTLKEKAEKIESAVRSEWGKIAEESRKEAEFVANFQKGFKEQLENHLEVFWAYQVIDHSGPSPFATAYKELERLVGAVKNVRPFSQLEYADSFEGFEYAKGLGERGRKCSVDGINNALFYRNRNGEDDNPPYDLFEGAQLLNSFYLNAGEGLSAVSFVKRFYPNLLSFPATAEVALMYDEASLPREEKEVLDCFKQLFKVDEVPLACVRIFNEGWVENIVFNDFEKLNDHFDYQYLFEENLNDKNFPNSKQLFLLQQLQKKLKPYLKTRYYAIVHFDGDKMGEWLSGSYNKSREDLEGFHETLSRLLAQFANAAREKLHKDNYKGQAIYAGGDDFLGFVNVHHLFEVMDDLRQDFFKIVDKGVQSYKKDSDKRLTFSAGIVVAHFKTPFSEVLKKVRAIEKKAKKDGGRDAFGITVLKHSGEIQEAIFKWEGENGSGRSNWKSLHNILHYLSTEEGNDGMGAFSNTFVQNLTTEFLQLAGIDLEGIDFKLQGKTLLGDALNLEIKRLVERSQKEFVSPEKDEEYRKDLIESVQALWNNAPYPETQNFIHALHIADFITRKTTSS